MPERKQIRVVKRDERRRAEQESAQRPAAAAPARDAAREVKDVVSGWVSEHRRRSEEFRRNYSTLLGELGLSAPRGARAV